MITRKEFRDKMLEFSSIKMWPNDPNSKLIDCEVAHHEADKLIIELLFQLGYGEGAIIFEQMEKWYS